MASSLADLHPELHVITQTTEYARLLNTGIVRGRPVVEFGVGTGVLTQLLLDAGARAVLGYEILPDVCTIRDTRFTLRTLDFTKVDYAYLCKDRFCVVSNPPYSTLSFLVERVLPHVEDVILMVPPRALDLFPGFHTEFTLPGTAFSPPSRGEHHVIRRGFHRL